RLFRIPAGVRTAGSGAALTGLHRILTRTVNGALTRILLGILAQTFRTIAGLTRAARAVTRSGRLARAAARPAAGFVRRFLPLLVLAPGLLGRGFTGLGEPGRAARLVRFLGFRGVGRLAGDTGLLDRLVTRLHRTLARRRLLPAHRQSLRHLEDHFEPDARRTLGPGREDLTLPAVPARRQAVDIAQQAGARAGFEPF